MSLVFYQLRDIRVVGNVVTIHSHALDPEHGVSRIAAEDSLEQSFQAAAIFVYRKAFMEAADRVRVFLNGSRSMADLFHALHVLETLIDTTISVEFWEDSVGARVRVIHKSLTTTARGRTGELTPLFQQALLESLGTVSC